METRIVRISGSEQLGHFASAQGSSKLEEWVVGAEPAEAISALRQAAEHIQTRDSPVAFPTETVYGLGADATRSASVKGIYSAKGRPSDNPLISHVCDLRMLDDLLGEQDLPIIYRPLVEKFWPGPLTILLPNPTPSKLAPEVTAGLSTFGVRMPSSPLALSLIKLAGVPLAGPSANASTKPSPTQAHHVYEDLQGRIELIIDGGPCLVGVESTVVDGLCDPPVVLRPGGVGIDELRSCPGWEKVTKAYKDQSEEGKSAPRAPGMKYKHYSPKARVVLYEATHEEARDGVTQADLESLRTRQAEAAGSATNGTKGTTVGVIRTKRWGPDAGLRLGTTRTRTSNKDTSEQQDEAAFDIATSDWVAEDGHVNGDVMTVDLGSDSRGIAQGLFSALRALDRRSADVIFVDGIGDVDDDLAAAVMNRLRKAASDIRS